MGGGVNSSRSLGSIDIFASLSAEEAKSMTFSEIFEKQFPWYLSLGMSYDDFWNNGDPMLCKYYRQAEKYRRKRVDEEQWMMGRYIYESIGALSPILHVNLSGKEVHAEPYMNMPILLKIEKEAEEKERKAKEEQKKQMAFMEMFASQWNKKWAETHPAEDTKTETDNK